MTNEGTGIQWRPAMEFGRLGEGRPVSKGLSEELNLELRSKERLGIN